MQMHIITIKLYKDNIYLISSALYGLGIWEKLQDSPGLHGDSKNQVTTIFSMNNDLIEVMVFLKIELYLCYIIFRFVYHL